MNKTLDGVPIFCVSNKILACCITEWGGVMEEREACSTVPVKRDSGWIGLFKAQFFVFCFLSNVLETVFCG